MQDVASYLQNLNEKQKEAVISLDGPLLILAGAGAGKTKTITSRIAHLMQNGVAGENILAVTFTNKAAKEMRERVNVLLDKNIPGLSRPFISTFHALGVHIIKENAAALGLNRHFTILDESDALSMLKAAVIEHGLDPKQHEPRKFRSIISRQKGEMVSVERFAGKTNSHTESLIARVWQSYEKSKQSEKSLDFDDLLLKSVILLQNNPEIRRAYNERFHYIHVDEYQDTNKVQYELARILAGERRNICVVGDGDQNIYSWRGANMKNILNFEKDYPNSHVVLLEQNYRSTKNILEAANSVIKKNVYRQEKSLFTTNETGELITLYEAYDEADEARYIAQTTKELIEAGQEPQNIAVLYRANFQSRVIEEAFLDNKIPYQVLGVKFFERKEIKDILSYLKAALNPESLSEIRRIINVPARGIGKVTIAKLFSGLESTLPASTQTKIRSFYKLLEDIAAKSTQAAVSETIKYVIQETGLEKSLQNGSEDEKIRLENMQELVTLALKYDTLSPEEGIEKLLEDAALASDQDSLAHGEQKNAVRLLTIHASKGLEFPVVFVTGLEQGLFPHERHGERQKPEDSEEERRLFYVALTRAGKKLYISYATIRTLFGSRQINSPSEFLYEIPEELIEREYSRNHSRERIIYLD